MSGKFLLIYICNFHVLSDLLLIYICKLQGKLAQKKVTGLTGDGKDATMNSNNNTRMLDAGKLLLIYR